MKPRLATAVADDRIVMCDSAEVHDGLVSWSGW